MNIHEMNWVALARAGDRGAMHELYERHRSRIFSLAYRYVRNVPDAEDILQDTFIKAFRSLKNCQLDDDAFFSSWIYRIAVNCAMDHFRSSAAARMATRSGNGTFWRPMRAGLRLRRRANTGAMSSGRKWSRSWASFPRASA